MRRKFWRIFRPHRQAALLKSSSGDDIYEQTRHKLESVLPRHPRPDRISKTVEQFIHDAEITKRPEDWLAALVIQAPRASVAQASMDKSPFNYRNKKTRLYELIDFNDAFVSSVLAMNQNDRSVFYEKSKELIDWICYKSNTPGFDDEQWGAIVRGLSREIALYLGAKNYGFDVYMTSRSQDALGIDMQIRDPNSSRYINVDCKSPSAFRYRLEELVREGRLTPKQQIEADDKGYTVETNGHGSEKAQIILLAMRPDLYGEVEDFKYQQMEKLRDKLNLLISHHGLDDGKFEIVLQ